jgi:hypothetical protein
MFFRLTPVSLSISGSATSAHFRSDPPPRTRRREGGGRIKKTKVFFFSLMKAVRKDEKCQIL